MKPMNDRAQSRQTRPALSPSPRKRLRIEKLEERIAPKGWGKGGKPVPSKGGSRCDDFS